MKRPDWLSTSHSSGSSAYPSFPDLSPEVNYYAEMNTHEYPMMNTLEHPMMNTLEHSMMNTHEYRSLRTMSPENRIHPDYQILNPELRMSSEFRTTSPEYRFNPEYTMNSPDLRMNSPDLRMNSPDLRMNSPEFRMTPDDQEVLEDEKSLFGINTWSKILDEDDSKPDLDYDQMSSNSSTTSSSQGPMSKEKTALCKFHLLGQCKKGKNCTFAHSRAELREGDYEEEAEAKNQGKAKTKLCKNLYEYGTCPYGSHCTFAHGKAELKATPTTPQKTLEGVANFVGGVTRRGKKEENNKENKGKICESFFKTGKCFREGKCGFAHGRNEHRLRI